MNIHSLRTHYHNLLPLLVIATLCLFFAAQTSKQLHNAFYILLLAPTLILADKDFIRTLSTSTSYRILIIFGLWMSLSITWSQTPNASNLKDVLYIFIFVACIAIAWNKRNQVPKSATVIFSAITTLATLYILWQWDGKGRLTSDGGIFSNPLTGANSLAFLILLNAYFIAVSKNRHHQIFFVLSLTLHTYAFFLCQSRSSAAGLIAGIIVLLFCNYIKSKRALIFITLSTLFIITLMAGFAFSKNWLALPFGKTQELHYQIPSKLNITTVQARIQNPSKNNIISLSSGKNSATSKNSVKLDSASRNVVVTLSSPQFAPYKHLSLTGTTANGKEISIPIAPPYRILQLDLTFGHRLDIWKGFIKHFTDSPIYGHGLSTELSVKTYARDTPFTDAHNSLVLTAAKGGIIGLGLHIFLLGSVLYVLVSPNKYRPLFLPIFICGLVSTTFDDPSFFDSPLPFWLTILIPTGYVVALQTQKHMSEKPEK